MMNLRRLPITFLCLSVGLTGGCSSGRETAATIPDASIPDASIADASIDGHEAVTDGSATADDGRSDASGTDSEAPGEVRDGSAASSRDASGSDGESDAAVHGRCEGGVADGRLMECLDRGVFALTTTEGAFVSWRLFGTDPADISFHLYRVVDGETARVCQRGPGSGTWCADPAPPADSKYFVRPVVAGVEQAASGSSALRPQDYLRIPLEPASPDASVHLAWVGDLDGDGEFDFVVDRIGASAPLVDAYTSSGTFLFRLNTGPLGADQNNIEGGAATISNGHWDGLTVYDFDGDGRAEIAIKTADGFVFGDGTTLEDANRSAQFVSIVSGMSGAELARARLPADFQA